MDGLSKEGRVAVKSVGVGVGIAWEGLGRGRAGQGRVGRDSGRVLRLMLREGEIDGV